MPNRIIHTIKDSSDEYVVGVLSHGLSQLSDAAEENYSPKFKDHDANLFYILKNGRYSNGAYYVIEEDNKYIASSGWNPYNEDTAVILTRTYVSKNSRAQRTIAEFFLPKMIEETKNFKHVWITFNEYNRHIYDWISARYLEKTISDKNLGWYEVYSRFKPIGIHEVYNTQQYVVELVK